MSDRTGKNWVKTQSVTHLEGVRTHAANFVGERASPRHIHQEYVFGPATAGAMEIDCGHCGAAHILEPNDLMLTESRRSLFEPVAWAGTVAIRFNQCFKRKTRFDSQFRRRQRDNLAAFYEGRG